MIRKPLNILVVAGGWSPEREVSLRGGKLIAQVLAERGHRVTFFDLDDGMDSLVELAAINDVAFLNLHGAPGEDGLVQALLDRAGCPYQGSGPSGSFLALHKAAAKTLFRRAGLLTADWVFLPSQPDPGWSPPLPFPLFVKSNRGGSSLHLYQVKNRRELDKALDCLFALNQEVILEPLISGQEVTCAILDPGFGPVALPPILIVPRNEFFDYHDKYAPDGADEICPAPLDPDITRNIQEAALKAHQSLGLRGYSRADFILAPDNSIYLLEVNTLPGMTDGSLLPKAAKAYGMDFGDLLETLIKASLGG